ncbi:hypothetical protein BC936DRAFT_147615 [Jimgerdemannia flammicorona]|uniref:Uncharacterized protein n=1 Tax=Jimgerdemannia flammicorona TaxID=994334 RepID=A0A433D4W2_9FUNG|nr:hypothetical protein BC936DRAFT_147615 [Jimgerdemannia flammicorona]
MAVTYGYEMEPASPNQPARLVRPPHPPAKVTLSFATSASKWVFLGTRPAILAWIRAHPTIVLETSIFATPNNSSALPDNTAGLVIDLLPYTDPAKSTFTALRTYLTSTDPPVRVEVRPKLDKVDNTVPSLRRVIVASGVQLGEIAEELERQWRKPTPGYLEQLLSMDQKPEEVVLEAVNGFGYGEDAKRRACTSWSGPNSTWSTPRLYTVKAQNAIIPSLPPSSPGHSPASATMPRHPSFPQGNIWSPALPSPTYAKPTSHHHALSMEVARPNIAEFVGGLDAMMAVPGGSEWERMADRESASRRSVSMQVPWYV